MENKANTPYISVIIPNWNGAASLDACIGAATSQEYASFEVIVVDDASTDGSVEIIKRHACKLVRLENRTGASGARNAGASEAVGEALFFTDSDCVMPPETLEMVSQAFVHDPEAVVGGTYSVEPHDPGFFNRFQAVFVNFSETKRAVPDYIATHAMLISREAFIGSGGFDEAFMPILEDVEFSHRLRAKGMELITRPEIQVRHIFGFNLRGSLSNAYRKTRYWVMYSLGNRDLFSDSGTASFELKATTAIWAAVAALLCAHQLTGMEALPMAAALLYAANLLVNARFLHAMASAHGAAFMIPGALYYTLLYPLPVALGGLRGLAGYLGSEHAR